MVYVNPKVIALIILLFIVGALVYWGSEERFEANPPQPDAVQQ